MIDSTVAEQRDKVLTVKLTETEHRQIHSYARAYGLAVSDLVRELVLAKCGAWPVPSAEELRQTEANSPANEAEGA